MIRAPIKFVTSLIAGIPGARKPDDTVFYPDASKSMTPLPRVQVAPPFRWCFRHCFLSCSDAALGFDECVCIAQTRVGTHTMKRFLSLLLPELQFLEVTPSEFRIHKSLALFQIMYIRKLLDNKTNWWGIELHTSLYGSTLYFIMSVWLLVVRTVSTCTLVAIANCSPIMF